MIGDLAYSTGINAPGVDYIQIYTNESYFRSTVAEKGIPEHLIDVLWKAIQSTRNKLDMPHPDGQTTRTKAVA